MRLRELGSHKDRHVRYCCQKFAWQHEKFHGVFCLSFSLYGKDNDIFVTIQIELLFIPKEFALIVVVFFVEEVEGFGFFFGGGVGEEVEPLGEEGG